MGNSNNHGQTASEVCSSFTEGSDTSSSWQEQTRQLEGSGEQYAELAYPERMGWQERTSERGESQEQETSSQSDYCGQASGAGKNVANTERSGLEGWKNCGKQEVAWTRSGGAPIGHADWWSVEPNLGRVAHGVAARMERIKAIGNGQVPLCAASAWRILK